MRARDSKIIGTAKHPSSGGAPLFALRLHHSTRSVDFNRVRATQLLHELASCYSVSVTFLGLVRNFEDEMGGFEKSAKTTHTPPRVPFQMKTRRTKARAATEIATAETVAVNTTDTYTITVTENLIHLVTRTHRRWLMSHRQSVYSSLLFFMNRFWNFNIKPDEYNSIYSNTQTILTTNVVYTSNMNPRQLGWVIAHLETRDHLLKIRLQFKFGL